MKKLNKQIPPKPIPTRWHYIIDLIIYFHDRMSIIKTIINDYRMSPVLIQHVEGKNSTVLTLDELFEKHHINEILNQIVPIYKKSQSLMLKLQNYACFIDESYYAIILHVKEMFSNFEEIKKLYQTQEHYKCVRDWAQTYLNELMSYFVSIGGEETIIFPELQSCQTFNNFLEKVKEKNSDMQFFDYILNHLKKELNPQYVLNPQNTIPTNLIMNVLCIMPSSSPVESVFAILKRMKHTHMNESTFSNRMICSVDSKNGWIFSFKYIIK